MAICINHNASPKVDALKPQVRKPLAFTGLHLSILVYIHPELDGSKSRIARIQHAVAIGVQPLHIVVLDRRVTACKRRLWRQVAVLPSVTTQVQDVTGFNQAVAVLVQHQQSLRVTRAVSRSHPVGALGIAIVFHIAQDLRPLQRCLLHLLHGMAQGLRAG